MALARPFAVTPDLLVERKEKDSLLSDILDAPDVPKYGPRDITVVEGLSICHHYAARPMFLVCEKPIGQVQL